MIVDGYDLMSLGAAGPSLLADSDWGVTRTTLGIIGTATAVGMPVGSILAGWASDRWGRRLPLAIALVFLSICMTIASFAPSLEIFVAARALTGAGAGALVPMIIATVGDSAPRARTFAYTGIAMTGLAFGGLLSSLVARSVATQFGFEYIFLVGAAAVLLVPLVWAFIPSPRLNTETSHNDSDANRWKALFGPDYRWITVLVWAAMFLNFVVVFGSTTWLPTLLNTAGYEINSSLEFNIAFNVGAILGTVAVTYAARDRRALTGLAVGSFLAGALAMATLSVVPGRGITLIACAFAGLGALGTNAVILAFIADRYPGWIRGTGLGSASAVGRLGAIVAPVFIAFVLSLSASGSATYGFVAIACPAVLGAAIVLALRGYERRRSVSPDTGADTERYVSVVREHS